MKKKYLSCHHLDHWICWDFVQLILLPWCSVSNFINDFIINPRENIHPTPPKFNSKLAPENREKKESQKEHMNHLNLFPPIFEVLNLLFVSRVWYLPSKPNNHSDLAVAFFVGGKTPANSSVHRASRTWRCLMWNSGVEATGSTGVVFDAWRFIGLIWKKIEVWVYKALYSYILRIFQQTPLEHTPRPSTTCLWRKSLHICMLGYLGVCSRSCWMTQVAKSCEVFFVCHFDIISIRCDFLLWHFMV